MPRRQDSPLPSGGGESAIYAPAIIACLTTDESCCIMCSVCGQVFAPSQPFKDESAGVRSDVLARQLYNHLCAIRKPDEYVRSRGHDYQ